MKLDRLLKIHRDFQGEKNQTHALCDGYLLRENFIYRNLRTAASQLGYSFVEAWPQYLSHSLLQLDVILETKKIPILDLFPIVQEINSKNPGLFETYECPGSFNTYHMHESAHVVGEGLFKNIKVKGEKNSILKMMICESFANASESMAVRLAFTKDHRGLIALNSYLGESKFERMHKDELIGQIGFRKTFLFVFYSYMYANFLYKSVSLNHVKRILRDLVPEYKPSPVELKKAHKIFCGAFDLSIGFRISTSAFYFKEKGYKKEILDLVNFDFYARMKKSKIFKDIPNCFADILEYGRLDANAENASILSLAQSKSA